MKVTFELPEDLKPRLESSLGDLSRRALEAIAVEAYRARVISATEVQRLLQLPSRLATDAFLKDAGAYLHLSETDLEQDIEAVDQALAQQ
jgi:predicted HTH domain antitoxin